ncbi:MAG: FkbM family methyltransferase, partial [Gammaproteobacteria bacterium]|nr:FkbM family methyltransferase [Gammaproteobacteria bacterium]
FNRFSSGLEPEMEILKYFVGRGDRVIDVGGNRGIYAYRFWKLGARVEIFEPNINCYGVLSSWVTGKKDVNVHNIALSNVAGSAYLHVPVDDAGIEHDSSGSVESIEYVSTLDQQVELRQLDSYHFEDVKFIKIDVEGHEASVIEGAVETIRSMKPSMLIEIEQRHNGKPVLEMFNRILEFGYAGYFLRNGRLVTINEFVLERDQSPNNLGNLAQEYINNFIFIHKSKICGIKNIFNNE